MEIVEHNNATPEQLKIHEVYPSYALFESSALWNCLEELKPNPATNEYHITEIPQMLLDQDKRVEVVRAVAPQDILSINTPEQLAEVEAGLLARLGKEVEPTS